MSLSAFLADNALPVENVRYITSKRFRNENGEPIAWEIRAITGTEDESIRKACTKRVPVPGKKNQYQRETDGDAYVGKLAVACTVYPNLNDKELQDSYHVMGAEELTRTATAFDAIDAEINGASQQKHFNNDICSGSSFVDSLLGKVKQIAMDISGISDIKDILNISDQFSNTRAQLNMLVDDNGSLPELEQKIMASAQRLGIRLAACKKRVQRTKLRLKEALAEKPKLCHFSALCGNIHSEGMMRNKTNDHGLEAAIF